MAEVRKIRAALERISPTPVHASTGARAAFHGDDAPEAGDLGPAFHARRAIDPKVDAAEKDESCRRFVALLVGDGHRQLDAEVQAMRHRSDPRLRVGVATVELKRARGKKCESGLALWFLRNPAELGEPGSTGTWREIDVEIERARAATASASNGAGQAGHTEHVIAPVRLDPEVAAWEADPIVRKFREDSKRWRAEAAAEREAEATRAKNGRGG